MSIKLKLFSLTCLNVFLTVLVGGLGLYDVVCLSTQADRLVVAAHALRSQGVVDMMHDSLKTDVTEARLIAAVSRRVQELLAH